MVISPADSFIGVFTSDELTGRELFSMIAPAGPETWGWASSTLEMEVLDEEGKKDLGDFIDRPDPGRSALDWVLEKGKINGVQEILARALAWDKIQDRSLKHLSTGEWKKTMLIRSLAWKNVFWEDPFEGLDAQGKAALTDFLKERAPGFGLKVWVRITREDQGEPWAQSLWTLDQKGWKPRGREGSRVGQPHRNFSWEELGLGTFKEERTWKKVASFPGIKVQYFDTGMILQDFHWDFKRGEKWQLSGPNGSGKTTLARLLVGDHPQVFGQGIQLFDQPRGRGESLWEIRRRFGFVSTALQNSFRGTELGLAVVLSGFFDTMGVYAQPSPSQMALARKLMALFGIFELEKKAFAQMGLGHKRILLLLRALVKNPPVLLLDEPTLGLDKEDRARVLGALDLLAGKEDLSLLYISHEQEDRIQGVPLHLELVSHPKGGYTNG